MALVENHMLNKDGADHARLRSLVNKAFTPRIIQAMRPRMQAIADELLDRVQSSKHMNVIDDYAFPLPIIVIAELLGIPAQDGNRFREWSDAVVNPTMDEASQKRFFVLMTEFTDYLRALFTERKANPREDLISALILAEDAGDKLSEAELFSMVVLLIVAGHETTVSLIGNGVLALLQHADALAELQRNPALWRDAVEEVLRYDSPVERALTRWVTQDTEMDGQLLRKGDLVIPLLASANRDELLFDQQATFDIHRANTSHIAFGKGIHYCLGAPLARMEGEVALSTLFHRLPNVRLAAPIDALEWRLIPMFRSLKHLPVAWD